MPEVLALPLVLAFVIAISGCGEEPNGDPAPPENAGAASARQQVTIDGRQVLVWGEGDYGVVLAHGAAFDAASWETQAQEIAAQGMVALAVEDISPEGITAAAQYLRAEREVGAVAMVGASAGADAVLRAVVEEPELADQLILLSPNSEVLGLADQPKLFVASEDEPVAEVSTVLADTAPGADNQALIIPGDAHAQNIFDSDQAQVVTAAILARLEQFSER